VFIKLLFCSVLFCFSVSLPITSYSFSLPNFQHNTLAFHKFFPSPTERLLFTELELNQTYCSDSFIFIFWLCAPALNILHRLVLLQYFTEGADVVGLLFAGVGDRYEQTHGSPRSLEDDGRNAQDLRCRNADTRHIQRANSGMSFKRLSSPIGTRNGDGAGTCTCNLIMNENSHCPFAPQSFLKMVLYRMNRNGINAIQLAEYLQPAASHRQKCVLFVLPGLRPQKDLNPAVGTHLSSSDSHYLAGKVRPLP